MNEIRIRAAKREDIPALLGLLREFAEYEDLLSYLEVDAERLESALFAGSAVAEALVAFDGDEAVGYAFFYPNFASFRGQRGFYLEDIYVRPAYRGKGVGEMILRELARLAASRGYERIDFVVLDWNTSAIGFYKKLGAEMDESERHFKFTDEAFAALAAGSSPLETHEPHKR